MKSDGMRCVVLAFVNKRMEQHTAETAKQVCGDPGRAGYVMDALTDIPGLQARLRELMDQTGDAVTAVFERGSQNIQR